MNKTKPKIKTAYNAKSFKRNYEVNNSPSMTVPDQSMTVPELLRRHARGLPLGGGRFEIYEGDEYVPDFKTMDISEIHELTKQNQEEIRKLQEEINKKRIAVSRAQLYEKIRQELEEARKEKGQSQQPEDPKTIS